MAAVRRCYQCYQPLPPQGGRAVTVDNDGTYRRWTPERASYVARFGEQVHVVALCHVCDAQEPAEAPEGQE
jgi:hypothetical protein